MWYRKAAADRKDHRPDLSLYTNGVLAASAQTTNFAGLPLQGRRLRQSNVPVLLGTVLPFPNDHASGFLDEVRIWNKARSAEGIQVDAYLRLSGGEANLAAYWNFDDGTANDLTGHGHDGTFSGNAHAVPMTLPLPPNSQVPHRAQATATIVNGLRRITTQRLSQGVIRNRRGATDPVDTPASHQ